MSDLSAWTPEVTIGMMVYNEEQFLQSAVECLLNQDFDDYELLIGDNASQDRTPEIVRCLADADPRIRHIRRDRNIGAIQNYTSLIREARGRFFVLAGAHDLWSKNYLRALKAALDDCPEAVIAYAPTEWIDENGNPLVRRTGYIDMSGYNALQRFNLALWADAHALYGMFRTKLLRAVGFRPNLFASGGVMLCELALRGPFIVVHEARWYRRRNRASETQKERIERYYCTLFTKPKKPLLPYWRLPWAYFGAALRAPLPLALRFSIFLCATGAFIRYGKPIISDIKYLPRRLIKLLADSIPSPPKGSPPRRNV